MKSCFICHISLQRIVNIRTLTFNKNEGLRIQLCTLACLLRLRNKTLNEKY